MRNYDSELKKITEMLLRIKFSYYTKHHLKFGKIKPTILDICDFGADFFLYFIGV